MSITIKHTGTPEAEASADGSLKVTEFDEYTVLGATSATNAIEELVSWMTSHSMLTRGTAVLKNVRARWLKSDSAWACTVSFETLDYPDPDEPPDPAEEEWDIGAESEKIFLPIGGITVKRPTGSSVSFPTVKFIGDHLDGEAPDGVEWPAGVTQFSLPKMMDVADVTESYRNMIEGLVGKLNAAEFRGRPAECVQFLGATCRMRGRGQTLVMYKFKSYPEKTISVDGFDSFTVPGFEYVWEARSKNTSSNQVVGKPSFLMHGKIGETANFGVFGL